VNVIITNGQFPMTKSSRQEVHVRSLLLIAALTPNRPHVHLAVVKPHRRYLRPVAAAVLLWAATASGVPVRLCADHAVRHVEQAYHGHDAGITELADRLSQRIATDVPCLPSVAVALDPPATPSPAPDFIPAIVPLGRDPPSGQSRAPPNTSV